MTTNPVATLHKLSQSGETIDGSANDIRGREVADLDGKLIGKISGLYIDDQEQKVRFLLVDNGGFLGLGGTKSLIPVDDIDRVTEHIVYITHSREHVAAAPAYDPKLVADDRTFHGKVYDYYGYAPYWGMGYVYPVGFVYPY